MKHFGDITKLSGYDLPVVDVITGGSPCQDLSVAGKRAGLDGERSGLFMEQIRITKEMRERDRATGRTGESVRPRYLVWENVPGAFSSNGGKDFQAVLTEIAKIAEPKCPDVPLPDGGKWSKSGALFGVGADGCPFSLCYRVHDAQFWGVPQRRKRISLVADFGGITAPEILFERKGLSGDFEPCGEAGEEAAGAAGEGVEGASCYGLDHVMAFKQGQGSKAGGIGAQEECAPTLSAVASGTNQVPAVYDARGNGDGKTVCTLTGDHQDRVTDYTALCVGNGQLNQMSMAEQANTLDTMHDQQAVMCFQNTGQGWWNESDIGATIRTPCGGDAVKANLVSGASSIVRRLTPLECERLQGYPDGWTNIGEWVDSKGKKHKDADSPRYKALGNSIALPFWQWMARRICAQYERTVTMGSLFDGIGGFPLVFQRCGAIPVWASEIEEFPIAVTKYHFPEEE